MKQSQQYNFYLPEYDDPQDVEPVSKNFRAIDTELHTHKTELTRLERDKATKLALAQHAALSVLDHPDASVTDEKLGERHIGGVRGLLQALLAAVGEAVRAITGAEAAQEWNAPPATTLAAAKAHADSAPRHVADGERTLWNSVSHKLGLAGGTLTGALTLHGDPTQNRHAATKEYVDVKMALQGNGDMTKAEYAGGAYGVVKCAETAQGCTGNAQTATVASSAQACTGNAATATQAERAQAIDGGSY